MYTKFLQFIIVFMEFLILKYFIFLGFYLNPIDIPQKSDFIVVLSGDTGQRNKSAIDLYKQDVAPKILFCGDGNMSAKEISKRYDIPVSDVFVELKSLNTLQNAINCSKILKVQNSKSIVLVTSGFHQYRSFYLFKKYFKGIIYNVSAPGYSWSRLYWWAYPQTRKFAFSEIVKIHYLKFKDYFIK